MTRYEARHAAVVRGTLRIQVDDVARIARDYARLGLRILRQSRERALIALPCGVTLVLSRRVSPRRVPVAA